MRNITRPLLFLLSIIVFLTGNKTVNAQSVTFNWNGTVQNLYPGYNNYPGGTVQTWTVPNCVSVITIVAAGGSGGDESSGPGGVGAIITGTVTVTSGHILDIIAAGQGGNGWIDGGGGGGGSFVWDATSSTLLVVAGGGSGAGYYGPDPTGANGQTNNATAVTLETPTPDFSNVAGAGGAGGNGGAAGANTNDGAACGAAGWLSNGANVAAGVYYYVGPGYWHGYVPSPAWGGIADPAFNNPETGTGGYGSGSGGGYNGGGAGGGYNGGGGGKGTNNPAGSAGRGGGSYCNGGVALSTALGSNDANGYVTISWVSSGVTASISAFTNILCHGGATGTITVLASGGAAPYTYLWNPSAQTNATATGLTAGCYTVTVTDHNGCTGTATECLTQPAILTATMGAPTDPACNGGNGSALVTAGGGTPGYTYLWNPGGNTNANATNLTAGSYTVTVTDHNGCTASASVSITQPTLLNASTSMTQASCGANNGTATVLAVGGTPAYTYSWNPGGNTNAIATGLSAGNYTVTVKDHNGCTATASIAVTSTPGVVATISAFTNLLCNGASNGSITVNAAGGTPAYTYSWNPGGNTNANATGLSAGCYTITVTDHNGCTSTASQCITQPTLLTATIGAVTNVACNNGTGSIAVNAAGGTPAYTYLWSPGGNSNANATGLSVGCYTVTVTDHDGCTATASQCITQPALLTATITASTNVLCNGGIGTATVTAGGGTPNYTYSWNPGGNTNAIATNLTAGSYTVTVRDANGCTATTSVIITQPTLLTATVTLIINPACNSVDGQMHATGGGGTPPYNYSWSPGGNTNANAILSAGCYTVTVTDANGCTASAGPHCITQPSALTANITAQTNVACNGGTGNATVTAGGGTPAYTYSWAPNGGTNVIGTGLTAGCYTVTVTDHNGCTSSATTCITQPTLLTASMGVPTDPACNGGNGSATVTAGGGTPNYTYLWNPGGNTSANATNLTAGSYTVTITDANGCTATAPVTITQPTLVTANITAHTNVPCNGGIGTATVTAGGGTPNYTYSWNPGGNTNANATNLTAGSYTVTVRDANGCMATTSVTITQPAPLGVTATFTQATCNLSNGSATANPTGGTPAYTYAWTPSGGTNAIATGISAGSYTVTVTDHDGCTASASVTVTQPSAVTANITASTGVSCNGGNNGTATVTAGGGTAPYTYAWNPNGGNNAIGTGLTAGSYTVTVTDLNGCTATASVTITQPTPLTATITAQTNVLCNGGTGTATVTAGGGTPNYTYLWIPNGGTNPTGTGLSAGIYTVKVTDTHGCTATASVTISQPTLLTATMGAPNNVPCNGGTGSATVTAGGGTPNYTYLWTPIGGTNPTGTGLIAGNYTVTVTDANGCTASASVTITQPTVLSTTVTFTHASCNLPNGTATAHPVGGTGPYAYLWTPSAEINVTATGLNAGSYTVTVTDAHGCTVSAPVTVTQPSAVTASISSTTGVSCNGGNNGTATALAGGGSSPYNYIWTPVGNTNNIATGLPAGSYTVVIADANGCTASTSTTITEPATLTTTASGPSVVCIGSSGNFTASASGGTLPYAYLWSNGATTSIASISPPTPRTYTVIVTDANGCTATAEVTVGFGPPLSVIISGQNTICTGGGAANLCANASGGTGGNTYLWTPSNLTTGCVSVSPASTTVYTVLVTDNCGANTEATTTVTVGQLPTVDMNADIYVGCSPLCVQFRNTSPTPVGGVIQYSWTFGNGDTIQSQNPIYCYKNSGAYDVTLTVSDSAGCSATMKKAGMITVYTPPVAAFTYAPQAISSLNPTVQFTNQSSDKYGIVYNSWTFGDATDSTAKNVNAVHTYQDTGNYCASLVVINEHGCTDTTTNCLVVTPAYTLYIPSAFSPNGDGVNDVFQPVGKYIKSFEMFIFDRWGMQLYHTTDITRGWNGTVNGGSNIAQEDGYIYKIIVTDAQDAQHSYVGNVSIIK